MNGVWSVARFSDDSDGSVIFRWGQCFSDFETALRFVVSVLDRESVDIAESCIAALESDAEITVSDIEGLYGGSEWIAIHQGERNMESAKNAPLCLRASVAFNDDCTVGVVWLP